MPHDVSLIATLAVAFVLASVFGYVATRMRLPRWWDTWSPVS